MKVEQRVQQNFQHGSFLQHFLGYHTCQAGPGQGSPAAVENRERVEYNLNRKGNRTDKYKERDYGCCDH